MKDSAKKPATTQSETLAAPGPLPPLSPVTISDLAGEAQDALRAIRTMTDEIIVNGLDSDDTERTSDLLVGIRLLSKTGEATCETIYESAVRAGDTIPQIVPESILYQTLLSR